MADKSQKTEQATPKHKKEMREKGNVAKSAELGGWATILIVGSEIASIEGSSANKIHSFLLTTTTAMGRPSVPNDLEVLQKGLGTALYAALPVVAIIAVLGTAIGLAQVGIRITPSGITPKWSRISLKNGIQNIFSAKGMWTLAKTLIKLAILLGVGYLLLHSVMYGVMGTGIFPLGDILSQAQGSFLSVIRYIGGLALITACIDYYFERRKYQQDLKMTKQEVKQEFREMEGSPEMKQARKNKARQLSRMQAMAAISRADVVVTNPTHYAVAIIYDREKDGVPRIIAKGEDLIAFEMREKALSCGVTVVENPPLARTIYSMCEVNQLIPQELYAAVAQLLAYVYSLSPTAKMFRKIHQMSNSG